MQEREVAMDSKRRAEMIDALRELLSAGFEGTQEEICAELANQGFEVNQSTVSRALRKIGAVKSLDRGHVAYKLDASRRAAFAGSLRDLVLTMEFNETLIVMRTVPGSAAFVGEYLDRAGLSTVLGTVAGDDALFVAPKSVSGIQSTVEELKQAISSR